MDYELKNHLPEVKRKEGPETVKITITVPKQELDDIDEATKLSGHTGDMPTPTAYGKAAFSMAAKRARGLINRIKQSEGKVNEYERCSE